MSVRPSPPTYYTTLQLATACQVSDCTVRKWFDTGIIASYRVPTGRHRRATREACEAFLAQYMPHVSLDAAASAVVLVVGLFDLTSVSAHHTRAGRPVRVAAAADWVSAGVLAGRQPPAAVVAEADPDGCRAAIAFKAALKDVKPVRFVGLVGSEMIGCTPPVPFTHLAPRALLDDAVGMAARLVGCGGVRIPKP